MAKTISSFHYPRFFAVLHKAARNLGLSDDAAREAYYRQILRDECGVSSIREIKSEAKFDRLMQRVMIDAGEYSAAVSAEVEKSRRTAFLIKVAAAQILQLSGVSDAAARSYFDAILRQSRLGGGFVSSGETFHLDLAPVHAHKLLQILDSHLRRLKRRYLSPRFGLSLDRRVRYERDGAITSRIAVDDDYYSKLTFGLSFA